MAHRSEGILLRHERVASLLMLLVPNVLVWILLYPGYFQADHQAAIADLSNGVLYQQHSLFWSFLAYPFIYLSPSYAIYGLVQVVAFTACAYCSARKFECLGIVRSTVPLCAFFGLFPTYLLFNECYSSDICFAYVLMPLTALLAELAESKGRVLQSVSYCLKLVGLVVIALNLRKNALLIGVVLLVVLPLVCRDQRKRAAAVCGSALIIALAVDSFFPVVLGARRSPSQELLSVPATQIARVYATGGVIPDEANAYLTQNRTAEEWAQAYDPGSADMAKAEQVLTVDFLRSWLEIGLHNPKAYVEAYFDLEYPFWTFGYAGFDYTAIDFGVNETFTFSYAGEGTRQEYLDQFNGEEGKSVQWLMTKEIQTWLNDRHVPVLTDLYNLVLCNRSLPLWTFVLGLALAKRGRRLEFLIACLPLACVVVSLLAFAPVAMMRYAIEAYYMLPLVWTYWYRHSWQEPTSRRAGRHFGEVLYGWEAGQ